MQLAEPGVFGPPKDQDVAPAVLTGGVVASLLSDELARSAGSASKFRAEFIY